MVVRLLEEEDVDLYKKLATFDAGKALCYLEGDRQRLLAIIEASYGDCRDFNAAAQDLFTERLEERTLAEQSRSIFFGAFRRSRATAEVQLSQVAPSRSSASQGALDARI